MPLSPVTPDSIAITIVYSILLLWGMWVGFRQIYQGFCKPQTLLNPLFGNRDAIKIFTFHIFVVTADLTICGPLAVANKSRLWYWGGRIALLMSSFPLASYFNRNPQSFGKLIGYWVRFRNFFEIFVLHCGVAALTTDWKWYYLLLYWIVAYRYLDVGPRRALQKLYNTPEKKAARPWAPILNWVTITTIYILTPIAVWNEKIIYAAPPLASTPEHIAANWEYLAVAAINVAVGLIVWKMMRTYTGPGPAAELLQQAQLRKAA